MLGTIGIRKEEHDPRVPLTPEQIGLLIEKHKLKVIVENSTKRAFSDEEYSKRVAIISSNLTSCNIIFGVKEIPIKEFGRQQAYCFFSHTIKGQSYNMPMLKKILDKQNTLMDYEKITDEQGLRQIAFGKFAGLAGMINTLWVYGQKLLAEGIDTPFSQLKQAKNYKSLNDAKNAISEVGKIIASEGLSLEAPITVCGFTGSGRVSAGAREIYSLLPTRDIEVADLAKFYESSPDNNVVYTVHFGDLDIVVPKEAGKESSFEEYVEHPERYKNVFSQYAPYLSMLVNGIYWESRYPKLLTKEHLKAMYSEQNAKLRVIGDITCDIDGSLECTVRSTTPDDPIYLYNPIEDKTYSSYQGVGPVVLALDKLPGELPRESSAAFGECLVPFVPELANADFSKGYSELVIPAPCKRGVIAHLGELTENYNYLQEFLEL